MPKVQPERVTLRHPSGKFSVSVGTGRASVLRDRGYTTNDGSALPPVNRVQTTTTRAEPARVERKA